MDFCDHCGILLPLEQPQKYENLCKACHIEQNTNQMVCECELCGEERPAENVLIHFRPRTPSPQPLLSKNCHRPASQHDDTSSNWHTPSTAPHKKNKSSDNNISPIRKGSKQKKREDSNTTNSQSVVQLKDDKINAAEEKCAENSGAETSRPSPADAVADQIREKWEREQADYKRYLCKNDIPDIAALVSGRRRKADGSRYYIGGVDISFVKGSINGACACLTVVQMPDLEMVYQRMETIELTQPYIPGFLAFREVPALQDLFTKLDKEAPQYLPDVILVDGNGTLHPRGLGLACQLGIVLGVPTVGVAKTLMSAQGIVDDANHKARKQTLKAAGEGFDLVADSGDVLGRCVRIHDKAPNPVYVSVGHKISLDSAVWLALECSKYRIPEPIRRADLDSREYIRQNLKDPQVIIK